MTIAESDGTRFAYIPEATLGTTPATPAFQELRWTGEGLRSQKSTIMSEEIRSDKNLSELIQVGNSVNGNFASEFSYATFDDLFEGLFRSSWATDVLINGLEQKSFTFEKTFEQGATDTFLRYRGVMVDSLTISMQPRQPIKLDWGLIGIGVDPSDTAIISGATYTAPNTNEIMPTGPYVGTVTMDGIVSVPSIRSLDLTIKSNLREQLQIGSFDLAGIAQGRFEVNGTLGLYFEDGEVYDAIQDHDMMSFESTIGGTTLEKYTLDMGAGRFTAGDPVAGGNGQDVAFDVDFQGIYNATDSGTLKITRGVA